MKKRKTWTTGDTVNDLIHAANEGEVARRELDELIEEGKNLRMTLQMIVDGHPCPSALAADALKTA